MTENPTILLAMVALLTLIGCAKEPAPHPPGKWRSLAGLYRPPDHAAEDDPATTVFRWVEADDLNWRVQRRRFAPNPWAGSDHSRTGERPHLIVDGVEQEWHPETNQPPAGGFTLHREVIVWNPADGSEPHEVKFRFPLDVGHRVGERWRLWTDDVSGDGIPLFPREVVSLSIPDASGLETLTGLFQRPRPLQRGQVHPGILRIRVGGMEVARVRGGVGEAPLPFQVSLGRFATEDTLHIDLEVIGPAGAYALFAPMLGPAVPHDPPIVENAGPNEFPGRRDDVVLFIADTFRADNLAAHGSALGVTPNLDRFAHESVRFEWTWSVSSWTLPAVSTTMLGRYPDEHGATGARHQTARLPSIASQFQRSGYRTAAVTDSLFVSAVYGLDHGFETFHELRLPNRTMPATLEAVTSALDRDDGRPLFLLVHTYEAHYPYDATDESFRQHGKDLGLKTEFAHITNRFREVKQGNMAWQNLAVTPDVLGEIRRNAEEVGLFEDEDLVEQFLAHYRCNVADLDGLFGDVRGLLQQRRTDRERFLVFTADHGELLGEHDQMLHGQTVYDPVLRVPLLIQGPGAEPGVRRTPASLVDLPRTLCELAGIEPHPDWRGRALMSATDDGPVFAFECSVFGPGLATVIKPPYKLVFQLDDAGRVTPRPVAIHDIEKDPGELRNLVDHAAGIDLGLTEAPATLLMERMQPAGEPPPATLSASRLREMEAVGYVVR